MPSPASPRVPRRPPLAPLQVIRGLRKTYPPFVTALDYRDAWQLLVAVMLSAQCTDERVNRVTPALFTALPTVRDFARVPQTKLERLVFSTGFYRSKARNLKTAANAILERHDGKVPVSMAELVALPGVGRKTANVVLQVIHGKTEGIVVDTHIYRVSRRTGAARGNTPEQVERSLMDRLDRRFWIEYGNLAIQHGRVLCHARKPDCAQCPLRKTCPSSTVVSRATSAMRR